MMASSNLPQTQQERIDWLVDYLLAESPRYNGMRIPQDPDDKKLLLRALMNVREPAEVSQEFLQVQDEYLRERSRSVGITSLDDLEPMKDSNGETYLWQGDITTLAADAIVNAANSQMLGCFAPNHKCIDNAIHTYSGVQLRLACYEIMKNQGYPEPTGMAKITPAFNLPSKYVIHTVGPIVGMKLTQGDIALLRQCYRSCLQLADQNDLQSIAFCCISTGEFHFPNLDAAKIAIQTVADYKREAKSHIKVVFNVFKELDYRIYRELLGIDS